MIKYFVFIIIIILLFILISCLFNLKEKFELNEVKNNQNTLKKLDLYDESIYYQKGEVGIGGEKGRRGDTGESGLDGARGERGRNGINGNNYGNIIFEDSNGEEIDKIPPYYSESNSITPIANDIIITIPDGIQGEPGVVPPIYFVKDGYDYTNHNNPENEILGSYIPPQDTYASTLEPIYINVPMGLVGDDGDSGNNTQNPQGIKGDPGRPGNPGLKGNDAIDSNVRGEKGLPGGSCDLKNPDKPDTTCNIAFESVKINDNGRICEINSDSDTNCCIDYKLLKILDRNNLNLIEQRLKRMIVQLCNLTFCENYGTCEETVENRQDKISYYRKEINDCYKILTEEDYPFDRQIALGAHCNCSEPIVAQFCSGSYIPNQQYVG